jgi:chemotaxis signal transduction protein
MEADVISGIARVGERIIPVLDLEHILIREEITEPSTLRQ